MFCFIGTREGPGSIYWLKSKLTLYRIYILLHSAIKSRKSKDVTARSATPPMRSDSAGHEADARPDVACGATKVFPANTSHVTLPYYGRDPVCKITALYALGK